MQFLYDRVLLLERFRVHALLLLQCLQTRLLTIFAVSIPKIQTGLCPYLSPLEHALDRAQGASIEQLQLYCCTNESGREQICTFGFGFQKCETQVCILPNNARLGSTTNPTEQKCTADFDFRNILNKTNPTMHFRQVCTVGFHDKPDRAPCTPWVQDPRVRLGLV